MSLVSGLSTCMWLCRVAETRLCSRHCMSSRNRYSVRTSDTFGSLSGNNRVGTISSTVPYLALNSSLVSFEPCVISSPFARFTSFTKPPSTCHLSTSTSPSFPKGSGHTDIIPSIPHLEGTCGYPVPAFSQVHTHILRSSDVQAAGKQL